MQDRVAILIDSFRAQERSQHASGGSRRRQRAEYDLRSSLLSRQLREPTSAEGDAEMEKRRVFGRLDTQDVSTPSRTVAGSAGNRSSPHGGGIGAGLSGKAKVNSSQVVGGSSTPTAGVAAATTPTSTFHGTKAARILQSPSRSAGPNGSSSKGNRDTPVAAGAIKARVLGYHDSPAASTISPTLYRTPPAPHLDAATPVSASSTITSPPPGSVSTKSFDRRVRAASTEPLESPTLVITAAAGSGYTRPASPKRRAFPSVATPRYHDPTTSPSASLSASSNGPRVAGGRTLSRPDPLKRSMTARPASAALLPSASIQPSFSSSHSSVFPSSSAPSSSLGAIPNNSNNTTRRAPSPIRRPASPPRASTSPTRSTTTPHPPPSPHRAQALPPASPSSVALKRPSTSSQSSSSTANSSELSPEIFSDSAKTVTRSGTFQHHRSRRRSQSLSSSVSSVSGLSTLSGGVRKDDDHRRSVPIPDLGPAASPPIPQSPLERKVQLDAKVNRKILDLEITNTSLLAINASLEREKVKQATEIRELRRRARERSYAPLHSAPLLSPLSDDFSWNGTEDDGEEELEWDEVLRRDTPFAEVVRQLERLNQRAQEALDSTGNIGGRVLNQYTLEADQPSSGGTGANTPNTTVDEADHSANCTSTDLSQLTSEDGGDDSTSTSSPEISIHHPGSLSAID